MSRTKVGRENPEFTRIRGIIGKNLRTAREKNGLSQAEVARSMGKAASWMTEVELGRSNLYVPDLWALAQKYGYPVDFFYTTERMPSAWRIPQSLQEWERMFDGDDQRAALHWNIDKSLLDARGGH